MWRSSSDARGELSYYAVLLDCANTAIEAAKCAWQSMFGA